MTDTDKYTEWQRQQIELEKDIVAERTKRFYLPILNRIKKEKGVSTLKVLDVGCGNGEGVKVINDHKLYCIGIDHGFRKEEWYSLGLQDRFVVANGNKLPFKDGMFDVVISCGVIEHIGAVGDSRELLPNYKELRKEFAEELIRVTSATGSLIITTPNRLSPVDFWHGPFIMGMRFHLPTDYFCLSVGDLKYIFDVGSKTRKMRVLPLSGLFMYKRYKHRLLTRVMVSVFNVIVSIISIERFEFLRRGCLAPFIVARIDK